MYVTPTTVQEARGVLTSALSTYERVYISRAVGSATQRSLRRSGTPSVDGLIETFLTSAAKSHDGLSAATYFGEKINNLLTLCREKDIELYNNSSLVSAVEADPRTLEQAKRMADVDLALNRPRPKTTERATHDAVVRSMVLALRGEGVESPAEANHWIITLDMRLILFDRDDPEMPIVPACLHPTALIQFLQYWMPRSAQAEEALFANFRLPVVLRTVDREIEHALSRILEVAGEWAEREELSPDAVVKLILNSTVQRRVAAALNDLEDDDALPMSGPMPYLYDVVMSEVAREYGRLTEENTHYTEIEVKLSELQGQLESLTQTLGVETSERENAEKLFHQLQQDVEVRKAERRYLAATAALALAGITSLVTMWLLRESQARFLPLSVPLLGVCLWGNVSARLHGERDLLAKHPLALLAVRWRAHTLAFGLSVAGSALATIILTGRLLV
jgi:hypothetical protein